LLLVFFFQNPWYEVDWHFYQAIMEVDFWVLALLPQRCSYLFSLLLWPKINMYGWSHGYQLVHYVVTYGHSILFPCLKLLVVLVAYL
jgi:hypothetical protein